MPSALEKARKRWHIEDTGTGERLGGATEEKGTASSGAAQKPGPPDGTAARFKCAERLLAEETPEIQAAVLSNLWFLLFFPIPPLKAMAEHNIAWLTNGRREWDASPPVHVRLR